MKTRPALASLALLAALLGSSCSREPPAPPPAPATGDAATPPPAATTVTRPGTPPSTPPSTRPPAAVPAFVPHRPDFATLQHERFKSTVDGDTIRLESGHKVRLLGIDTPEHDEPLFAEARALTKSLLDKKEVLLEFDTEREDAYQRWLAYVWVRPAPGGEPIQVQASLLEAGLARYYGHHLNAHHNEEFLALQQGARAAHRGLWALPAPPAAEFYVSSRTSDRFHRPTCEHVAAIPPQHRLRFDSRDHALDAGKSPCRTCKP